MRVPLRVCAVLVALGVSFPARATVFLNVSVNGTLTGTTTTVMCNPGSPVDCLASFPGGVMTAPFNERFSLSLGMLELDEGDNDFSFGNPFSTGLYDGIINDAGGVLTGRNLQFSLADSSCRFGTVGCRSVFASASTVDVSGGVPEPSTWLLMLLGFGVTGFALRRHKRSLAQFA